MNWLKQILIVAPTAALGLITVTSSAYATTFSNSPIQTINLDSTNPNNPSFSVPLANGVKYKFVASGIFTPDYRITNPNWLVDARFVGRNNFSNPNDIDPQFSNYDFGVFSNTLGGNNDDFWGTYQANHIYSYEYTGTGTSVDFYINDIGNFSGADNAGTLTVQIFQEDKTPVPEPASTLGLLAVGSLGISSLLKRKLQRY